MAGLDYFSEDMDGTGLAILLYHPRRPCANPVESARMNKQARLTLKRDHD